MATGLLLLPSVGEVGHSGGYPGDRRWARQRRQMRSGVGSKWSRRDWARSAHEAWQSVVAWPGISGWARGHWDVRARWDRGGGGPGGRWHRWWQPGWLVEARVVGNIGGGSSGGPRRWWWRPGQLSASVVAARAIGGMENFKRRWQELLDGTVMGGGGRIFKRWFMFNLGTVQKALARKRNVPISEYRQVVPVCLAPHIFVVEATSLMNISLIYLSVMWPHRRIYGVGKSQTRPPLYSAAPTYIRRFRIPTNIFWIIFIDTDKCIVTN
jgi:hypothetical protein